MKNFCFNLGVVIGTLAVHLVVMCLEAWAVQLLWNWVAVDLFNAPTLSFWVAYGLCLLCGLLFRPFPQCKMKFKK